MIMNDINEEEKRINPYMSLCLENTMASMKIGLWALNVAHLSKRDVRNTMGTKGTPK
jgi:hypothetical protein